MPYNQPSNGLIVELIRENGSKIDDLVVRVTRLEEKVKIRAIASGALAGFIPSAAALVYILLQ